MRHKGFADKLFACSVLRYIIFNNSKSNSTAGAVQMKVSMQKQLTAINFTLDRKGEGNGEMQRDSVFEFFKMELRIGKES